MISIKREIAVLGASLGGTLAALSAAKMGKTVVLTENTDWIGGQLTSQAVPPDEHKWIEEQGCTRTYREYRNRVREYYRSLPNFLKEVSSRPSFCPGGSEVSRVAHPPKLALSILEDMIRPFVEDGSILLLLSSKLLSVETDGDKILSATYLYDGEELKLEAEFFLDGTDTGEVIKKSGAKYFVGAESKAETGETHALEVADPEDMQPQTYTAALENRLIGDFTIEKPDLYDEFKDLYMSYDKYKVYSMFGPDSSTGKAKEFGMFEGEIGENGEGLFPLFNYRRIVCSKYFTDGSAPYDVTLLNWPQNDYFLGNLFDTENDEEADYRARQFTLGFVYWLQTEAPRKDGGKGYPFFRLAGEYLGTDDGLTKAPYIRESRRIKAKFTVTEEMVKEGSNPVFKDSVGVGSYPIDLHITTKSHTFFYEASERFTIPLGAMIPERMENLIPACKNIGTTHLTNGCYRLHPVEWNIGEVAGYLAAFCLDEGKKTVEVWENKGIFEKFSALLEEKGIQRYWK